jgi:hypothetical protein
MTDNREAMLDKVRALLNKTKENGCTEAEELAALAKARAMIDAYEITDAELKLTKEEGAVMRKEPPGTADPWLIKYWLTGSVSEFCNCEGYRERNTGSLVFVGVRSDAQFATWLLDHLQAFVLSAMVEHLAHDTSYGQQRRIVQNSFAKGCCVRIAQRLKEIMAASNAAQVSNGRALMVLKNQLVKDRLEKEGIKLRKGRASSSSIDPFAFAAGKAAGDRASFGRPVQGAASVLRLK